MKTGPHGLPGFASTRSASLLRVKQQSTQDSAHTIQGHLPEWLLETWQRQRNVRSSSGSLRMYGDNIWAEKAAYVCLMIKWHAVESHWCWNWKTEMMVWVCVHICVCMLGHIFDALEETSCSSTQVIPFRLWNFPLKGHVIDCMQRSHLMPTYEKVSVIQLSSPLFVYILLRFYFILHNSASWWTAQYYSQILL